MAFSLVTVAVTNVDTTVGEMQVQIGPEGFTFDLTQLAGLIAGQQDRTPGLLYNIACRLSADQVSLQNGAAITNSIQRAPFEL